MTRKAFYVRFPREGDALGPSMATGIQVIIPEGLTLIQARDYIIGRVIEQLCSYAASECASAFKYGDPYEPYPDS